MNVMDVLNSPWALPGNKLREVRDIYLARTRGEKADLPAIEAALGRPMNNERPPYSVVNGIALIPVEGMLAKKMNLFTRISGGTSTQLLRNDIQTALDDQQVTGIILLIDSPGGTVDGTQDIATFVHEAGSKKPITAFSDGMIASGAYWIAAAAGEIYISADTVEVGSIGVVTSHTDYSGYEDRVGIKTTEITAGKYKRIASEHAPLSDEGLAYIKGQLDYLYSVFVDDVAKFRGVSVDQVLSMADGKIFIGKQAIDAGLVDGKMSLDTLIAQMAAGEIPLKSSPEPTEQIDDNKDENSAAASAQTASKGADMDLKDVTKERIAAERPDLADAFRAEGKASGVSEGATAERERIKAVEAQTLPGHEKLISTLKFDGKTTGPEAAVAVLNAEKEARGKQLAGLRSDAEEVGKVPSTPAPEHQASANSNLPVEERTKHAWDKDAKIRAEFGTYESYLAFEKAMEAGQVKVLSKA